MNTFALLVTPHSARPSHGPLFRQDSLPTSASGSDIASLNESALQELITTDSLGRSMDSAVPARPRKPSFQRSYSKVVVLASTARGSILLEDEAEDEETLPLKSAPPTVS